MDSQGSAPWKDRLRQERIQRNWRQHDVAERLGTTVLTVHRWERGYQQPGAYFRIKLCALFGKSAEELGFCPVSPQSLSHSEVEAGASTRTALLSLPPIISRLWSVPYPRTPFFTGREEVLRALHEKLTQEHAIALSRSCALTGLGGIGKTQTAIEYAYRYTADYSAVFWINAETLESIISSFATVADVLSLPEKEDPEQNRTVTAVIRWLNDHHQWLLIFDNIEELELVKSFLPSAHCGSLLFTSRRQALGISAHILNLEKLTGEESRLFLLYRARLLAPGISLKHLTPADEAAVRAIVEALDGLPLALDQAGSYIEETHCDLEEYLQWYQQQRLRFLERRGHYSQDHPASVATTLLLSFQKVKKRNPAAADVLQFCAFLAPEAIPEEILVVGFPLCEEHLQALIMDPWLLNEVLALLGTYSLLRRHPRTKTLSLHRLIQTVLQESIPLQERKVWIRSVVTAINHVFPVIEQGEPATWKQCERLLPHALQSAKQSMSWQQVNEELATLLGKMGAYLTERAQYETAESLLKQALQIRKHIVETPPEAVSLLNDLGRLSHLQGHYDEAHYWYQQALDIWKHVPDDKSPRRAETFHGLAVQYAEQGKFGEAQRWFEQALHLRVQLLGNEHPQVAETVHGLGRLSIEQGRYAEAELLLKQALQIREKMLGPEHFLVSSSLHNLGRLYCEQRRYAEAEPVLKRALQIKEQAVGNNHPQVAMLLNSLGIICYRQGRYAEAKRLLKRVIHIWEQAGGANHPQVAYGLTSLAVVCCLQGRYTEAEPLLKQALEIREQTLGRNHLQATYPLTNLGEIYVIQGRYTEAEPLLKQALQIREQALGWDHPKVGHPLTNLGLLCVKQERYTEAEEHLKRALCIRSRMPGADRIDESETLKVLGYLYLKQGRYAEAEPLLKKALCLAEQILGAEHPELRSPLSYLAQLLGEQGHYEEAERLAKRALSISEKWLDFRHPLTAEILDLLTNIYTAQRKYTDASSLHQRVLAMRET